MLADSCRMELPAAGSLQVKFHPSAGKAAALARDGQAPLIPVPGAGKGAMDPLLAGRDGDGEGE